MEQLDLETLRKTATLLSDPASVACACKDISTSVAALGRSFEFAWFCRWHKELCPCRPWQYCALTWGKLKHYSLPQLVQWMLEYASWCAATGVAVKLRRNATAKAHKQLAVGNAVTALHLLCPHARHLLLGYAVTARRHDLVSELVKPVPAFSLSLDLHRVTCTHNSWLTAALAATRCRDPRLMLLLLAASPRPLKKWERRLLVNHAVELGQPEALIQLHIASTSHGKANLQLRHHHLAKAAARTDAGAAAMVQHLLGALPKKILQPKYLLPVYAAACRFANPHVLAVLISHALAAPAQLQLPASMLCAAAAQGAVLPAPLRLVLHALKIRNAQLSQAGTANQQQQQPPATAAAVLGRKRRVPEGITTVTGETPAAAADGTGSAAAVGTGKKRRGSVGVVNTVGNAAAGDEAAAAGSVQLAPTANSGAGDATALPATVRTAATGSAGDRSAIAAGGSPAAAAAGAAATAPPSSNEPAVSPALLARALMHLLGSKFVWKERLGRGKIRHIPTVEAPELSHADFVHTAEGKGFCSMGTDPLRATQYASTVGQLEACQELWGLCGEFGSSMQQQVEEVVCAELDAAGFLGGGMMWSAWGRAVLRWMLRTLPMWKEQHGQEVEKLSQSLPQFSKLKFWEVYTAEGSESEEDSKADYGGSGEGRRDGTSRGPACASSGDGVAGRCREEEEERGKQQHEAAGAAWQQQQDQDQQQQQNKEQQQQNQQQPHKQEQAERQQQQEQRQEQGKEGSQHQQEQQQDQGAREGEGEGDQQQGNQQQQLHEQGQHHHHEQHQGNQQQQLDQEEGAQEGPGGPVGSSEKSKFILEAYTLLSELGIMSLAAGSGHVHTLDSSVIRHLTGAYQQIPLGTEIGPAWGHILQLAVRQCLPGALSWMLGSLNEADRARMGVHPKLAIQALCPWLPGYAAYAARLWVMGAGVVGRGGFGTWQAVIAGGGAGAHGGREGVGRAKRHTVAAGGAVTGGNNDGMASMLHASVSCVAVAGNKLARESRSMPDSAAAALEGAAVALPVSAAATAGYSGTTAAELTAAVSSPWPAALATATGAAVGKVTAPSAALLSDLTPAGLVAAAAKQLQWRSSWVVPVSSSRSWRDALGDVAMSLLEAPWAPTGALSYWLESLRPRTYPDTSGVLTVMERVLGELEKGGVEGLPQGAKGFKSMRGVKNVMLRGDMDVLAAVVTWGTRLPADWGVDSDAEDWDDDDDDGGSDSGNEEEAEDGEGVAEPDGEGDGDM